MTPLLLRCVTLFFQKILILANINQINVSIIQKLNRNRDQRRGVWITFGDLLQQKVVFCIHRSLVVDYLAVV